MESSIKAKRRGVIGNVYNEAFKGKAQNQQAPTRKENDKERFRKKWEVCWRQSFLTPQINPEFHKDSVI